MPKPPATRQKAAKPNGQGPSLGAGGKPVARLGVQSWARQLARTSEERHADLQAVWGAWSDESQRVPIRTIEDLEAACKEAPSTLDLLFWLHSALIELRKIEPDRSLSEHEQDYIRALAMALADAHARQGAAAPTTNGDGTWRLTANPTQAFAAQFLSAAHLDAGMHLSPSGKGELVVTHAMTD